MITLSLPVLLFLKAHLGTAVQRLDRDQRGEGVISAAIAVLVMAFLGAAMWIAFDGMFTTTTDRTTTQVEQIGN